VQEHPRQLGVGVAFVGSSHGKVVAKTTLEEANPRKRAGKKSKKLSPARKASAKRAARKAGRRYPSLVDNMNAAKKKKRKKTKKRQSL
jgi:hypothetical protein